jgi:hypothetical protein
MADDVTPVETAARTMAPAPSGAPGTGSARRSGLREAGFQSPVAAGRPSTTGPDHPHGRRVPHLGISVTAPLVSATVEIPGRGATARLGPARISVPTGALLVGGAAAMAVAGSVELPLVLGGVAAGLLLGRRRARGLLPTVSLFDTTPRPRG